MRFLLLLAPALLLVGGCVSLQMLDPSLKEDKTALVATNPFAAPGAVSMSPPPKIEYKPADEKVILRVYTIGQQLVTANPEIAMRPAFLTCGTSALELCHVNSQLVHVPKELLKNADGRIVYITAGLVERCKTDGQLAALLAHELAQMVVEREVLANPHMRAAEERPPERLLIGNGVTSSGFDQARMAELARYDKKRQRNRKKPLPLPDPEKLTRRYLEKAGYSPAELDNVKPLLDKAEQTYMLEKQVKQSSRNHSNWTAAPR